MWGDLTAGHPGSSTSGSVFVIEAGYLSAESTITLLSGDATRVKSTIGDLKCRLIVDDGNVGSIISAARITGYGGAPSHIKKGRITLLSAATEISQFQSSQQPYEPYNNVPMMLVNEGIESIEAGTFINARIKADDTTGGDTVVSDGSIHRIITAQGIYSVSKIECKKLAKVAASDQVRIGANLSGELVFHDMDPTSTIAIGGSLSANGKIIVDAGHLKGQIVINANGGTGSSAGTWSGDVIVGGQAIPHATYYAQSSSAYGGGAVGVVPFGRYLGDTTYNTGSAGARTQVPTANSESSPLVLVPAQLDATHGIDLACFGRVTTLASGDHFVYVYKPMNQNQEWVDVTCRTTQSLSDATATEPLRRSVKIRGLSGYLFPKGAYRITTVQKPAAYSCSSSVSFAEAYCGDMISPAASELGEFNYWIKVVKDCNGNGHYDNGDTCQDCGADVDDGSMTGTPDGGVDINDLLYYLQCYEAGGLCADMDDGSGSGTPDQGVDINDLLYFLAAYEAGC